MCLCNVCFDVHQLQTEHYILEGQGRDSRSDKCRNKVKAFKCTGRKRAYYEQCHNFTAYLVILILIKFICIPHGLISVSLQVVHV